MLVTTFLCQTNDLNRGAKEMREPVEAYYSAVYELTLKVLDMIACALPYDVKELFARFTDPALVAAPLRLLHYPPARRTTQRQLGSSAHTDFGAITLLMQDGNPGLQVQNHNTGEWMPVPSTRYAYVVNVGDMLQMWTGGLLKSSVHRVINRDDRDRYSVVFFFDGNLDCPLLPLDESERKSATNVPTVESHMVKRITNSYKKAQKKF
jgi:isopenicillin N synthase-like dioxygenase